jgi:hypothetical protein
MVGDYMSALDNDLDKISRVVYQATKDLSLRMHIKLVKEKDGRKENFHQLFTTKEGNKYLKLDLQSFLTLEITSGEWSPDKSIFINQKNLSQIKRKFKKMLDNIYGEEIFAMNKKNEVFMYADTVEKYTEKIFNLGGKSNMIVSPAVIYDENEVTYEGVIIYINKSDNYVELPIDTFEALYDVLEKADLFVYSQLLLAYYMSTIKDQKVELKEVKVNENTTNKKRKPSIFEPSKEEVKSNIYKKPTTEEIFGITERSDD